MSTALLLYEQRKAFRQDHEPGEYVFDQQTGEFSETSAAVMRQARDNMKPQQSSASQSLSPDI